MEEEEGGNGHQQANTRGWDIEAHKERTMTTRAQMTEPDALIRLQNPKIENNSKPQNRKTPKPKTLNFYKKYFYFEALL